MRFAALIALLSFTLAGCGGPAQPVWAPDEAVKSARFSAKGPPRITLFTVVDKRNGSGAHSALLISGDERVLFDPAGSFSARFVPERNDVLFGMTDRAVSVFIDYHARATHDVVVQRLDVTPAQAALALSLAKSYGAVPKAQCTLSITRILSEIQGFETVTIGYFPNTARQDVKVVACPHSPDQDTFGCRI